MQGIVGDGESCPGLVYKRSGKLLRNYLRKGVKMTENQKRIFHECAKEVQDTWVLENFKKDTQDLIQKFTEKKVDMYYMTKADWDLWYKFSQDTAWKEFENTNAKCKELLEMAKAARV